jgi:hypothetical protein
VIAAMKILFLRFQRVAVSAGRRPRERPTNDTFRPAARVERMW